jgi:hypothetical protein
MAIMYLGTSPIFSRCSADVNRRAIGFFCDAACARTPDKVGIIDLFGGREREVTYRLTTAAAAFCPPRPVVVCRAAPDQLGSRVCIAAVETADLRRSPSRW